MKITSMSKAIISALIIIFGIIVFILGLSETFDFYGYYTYYETYGGDAYTGIQHAAADTSKNLNNIGYLLEDFLNLLFVCGGVLIILFGSYLLASNVTKIEKPKSQSVDASNKTLEQNFAVQTSNNDVTQNNSIDKI